MSSRDALPAALAVNVTLLKQGAGLLSALDQETYTRRIAVAFDAAIGGHMRHVIEHYQALLTAVVGTAIDYEARPRLRALEQQPAAAARLIADIIRQLERLAALPTAASLPYCIESAPGSLTPTTVLRELEFLSSHTVHHFALIAVMCRLQDHEPGAHFGMAPSTLRHEQAEASCAR